MAPFAGGRLAPGHYVPGGVVVPFADTNYFAENFAITKSGMVAGIGLRFQGNFGSGGGTLVDFATGTQVSKWWAAAPVFNIGFSRDVRILSIQESGLLLSAANGPIKDAGVGVYINIDDNSPFIVWPSTSPVGSAKVIFEIEQFDDGIVRWRIEVIFTQNA